jgi:hypothetical protein
MRRAILVIAVTFALMSASSLVGSLRAVGLGLTQVTLTCDDGNTMTVVVDTDTLTGLTDAVHAMIDYPAGVSCALVQNGLAQAPASSMPVFADDPKDYVVAGGRVDNCLNFAVSAHSDAANTPSSTAGTIGETIPDSVSTCSGGFGPGHYKASVVCLSVSGNVAHLNADVVPGTAGGSLTGFDHVEAAFVDNGNPVNGVPPDQLRFSFASGPAPVTSGCNTVTPDISPTNGNIVVHDS